MNPVKSIHFRLIIFCTVVAMFGLCCADRGALESFENPIIFADYSDPDVIRVNDDFYMVSSSFAHTPGLPVLHSKDLVNWTIIGHAVQNLPDPVFEKPQHGKGVWAPSIRYRNGEFWIYYGDPDLGIFLVKAKSPAGPWKEPVLVKSVKGWIDPCPFWDNDGKAYLIHAWAKSRVGFNSVLTVNKLSSDGTEILDEGVVVVDGHENHPTIEGPKFYKRNGYYYIFAPAGGVRNGWQTVFRSKNIYGPYEDKIVLEQGSTDINGPHQGAWVETASGESWFVHFQDRDAYGRIVHLQPMRWENDWPVVGEDLDGNGIGEPILTYRKPNIEAAEFDFVIQTSDNFDVATLGLQWQWQTNFKENWFSLSDNAGALRLYAVNPIPDYQNLWDLPNIPAQKFPSESFEVTTKFSFHPGTEFDKAGLVIIGGDYASLTIAQEDLIYQLTLAECKNAEKGLPETVIKTADLKSAEPYLKVRVSKGAKCQFSYSLDGNQFMTIGREFQAKKGKWVGAKVGLVSTTLAGMESLGYADFDFFHVNKIFVDNLPL